MAQSGSVSEQSEVTREQVAPRRRRVPRWVVWGACAALVVLAVLVAAGFYVARHAEPILRQRVIANLEDRFHSPVQLDALHISVMNGLQVTGSGLRILSLQEQQDGTPARAQDGLPMLSVASFEFRTTLRQLLEPKMRLSEVLVQGMRVNIPPRQDRGPLLQKKKRKGPKMSIVVDRIVCSDMTLTVETNKPGKLPLVFPIHDLTLHDVGGGGPTPFEARLVNPKPVGDIASHGHFGPWHDQQPRETPLDGDYSFTNADLDPIKGIGGTLSSHGTYGGVLGEIGVVGTTDVPNFSLDVTERPVDLKTVFNATVDGTTGDTILNSVHATFLHTVLQVSGRVVRATDRAGQAGSVGDDPVHVPGHFIDISVASEQARVEDILRLAAKTSPPLMRGALSIHAQLHIPPGKVSVSKKMDLRGNFSIRQATFSNPHWQETVDKLSMRAQGHPGQANAQDAKLAASSMGGSFALAGGLARFPDLQYEMPGAKVKLAGKYSMDGQVFNFAGTVDTEATASEMLSGWKKWVAMPFDPLFQKNGAGLEVPVTISGTKSDPKFGVDKNKLFGQIFSRHKQKDAQPQQP